MSEMLEKAAKAILAKVPYGYGMTEVEAEAYARAALESLKEFDRPNLWMQKNKDDWDDAINSILSNPK